MAVSDDSECSAAAVAAMCVRIISHCHIYKYILYRYMRQIGTAGRRDVRN